MEDGLTFAVIPERPLARSDQDSELDIAIELSAARSVGPQSTGFALNLCLVIDRSGSMDGPKLEKAKQSCLEIFRSLNPDDQFTLLAFDDLVVSVVNPQTPPSQVEERIASLQSGGSTNLSQGWYSGLLDLQTYSSPDRINRLLLLSDGQANAGETKPSVLADESRRTRDELGITTSTIGVGRDFQEDILVSLATHSGGRFWFIDEARIEDIIKEEFTGALSVFLERPNVVLSLPDGVSISRELNHIPKISDRYRLRPLKSNDHISLAVRLAIRPEQVNATEFTLDATLYDGEGVVQHSSTPVKFGSLDDVAASDEDERVTSAVTNYLASSSDEQMVERIDAGDFTTMAKMLREQSSIMKTIESKLSRAGRLSWEERQDEQAQELGRFRMKVAENENLVAIIELIDLLQGLGDTKAAVHLGTILRKSMVSRGSRDIQQHSVSDMDELHLEDLGHVVVAFLEQCVAKYPGQRDRFEAIRKDLYNALARSA